MNRRGFIKAVTGLFAAATVPKLVEAQPEWEAEGNFTVEYIADPVDQTITCGDGTSYREWVREELAKAYTEEIDKALFHGDSQPEYKIYAEMVDYGHQLGVGLTINDRHHDKRTHAVRTIIDPKRGPSAEDCRHAADSLCEWASKHGVQIQPYELAYQVALGL